MYDLILKKRNGEQLTEKEIDVLISLYAKGKIPDYQMAAFCMAIYFQSMTAKEITALTMAMANSGDCYNLDQIKGKVIDKHSSGGVGDTTTLIVAPLVASCGVPIAKMSGRSLGHTGGTIDKLESIPGFKAEVSKQKFIQQVNEIKICLMSQSKSIAPADQRLYALRDVTATVDIIPLIASSIMSKKIAAGANGFVLDVKYGSGAFMKTTNKAVKLAKTMVEIGAETGKPTIALVTNMNQPLGYMIGNSLEIKEAILTLSGQGPEDLTELSLRLAAEMLVLADHSQTVNDAYKLLSKKLKNKDGLTKFKQLLDYQGGNPHVIEDLSLLPKAKYKTPVYCLTSGFIQNICADKIGNLTMILGAGRKTKASIIDHSVGIELTKKAGDYVSVEQPIAYIYSNTELKGEEKSLLECFRFGKTPPSNEKLVYKKISTSNDV